MPVRTVRIWPDPALTTVAEPVTTFDGALQTLVADLFATMHEEEGIGLAANQVGVLQRVLVVDLDASGERTHDADVDAQLREENFQGALALVNPVIVARSGKVRGEEGCLSVPGVFAAVERSAEVTVEAQDPHGKPLRVIARGLFAVCLQHEMDHLDGKVFVDYLSELKRNMARRKMMRLVDAAGPEQPPKRRAS